MVTYIKIGTCDELKEWGKYDPIPATTECCCCGTTVIDIITPNKDKPIVVPDKPKDDTPTNPSDNGGSDSGNTNPTTPTNPSDNGNNGNTDNGNTTPTTPTEQATVTNNIVVKGKSDVPGSENRVLLTIPVKGKVGETVRVGDFITPEILTKNGVELNGEGNIITDKSADYNIEITPNLKDYIYTIKEEGHEFVVLSISMSIVH